jgi:DegV family protein with EDD domain
MAKPLSGADVEVFDTRAGSLGHGLQVMKAAQLAEQGATRREIVAELERYRQDMTILILLDTLENIVKGGRLSRFQGSLANILNIKILLEGVEGAVVLKERVMGKKRFLRRILDRIGESCRNLSDRMVGITHIDNLADAEYLSGEIQRLYQPQGVIVNHMGSTMGTYAGRGGMIVCF